MKIIKRVIRDYTWWSENLNATGDGKAQWKRINKMMSDISKYWCNLKLRLSVTIIKTG